MGHFEMPLMWGPGSILDSYVTQEQGGSAGREVVPLRKCLFVLIFLEITLTSSPALPTPRPTALRSVGALPVSPPQGPF